MGKSRLLIQSLLACGVTIFFVFSIAGATTIGTNIDTGGTLTVSGNTTIDTSTFYVDAANNRVGIGTTTPDTLLDVDGIGTFGELCFGSSCITGWNDAGSIDGSGTGGQLAVWSDSDTLAATGTLPIAYGGTGLSSTPSYGQMLVAAADGTWTYIASSSLGTTDSGGNDIAVSGTTGQIPYYAENGTTLSATSSISLDASGNFLINGINYAQYSIDSAGTYGKLWASDGDERGTWMGTSSLGLLSQETVSSLTQYNIPFWDNPAFANSPLWYLSGNVGIGTTTPDKKLQVMGESKLGGDVTLESGNKITNSAVGTIGIDAPSIAVTPLVATDSGGGAYVADLDIGEYATGTLLMVTFTTANIGDATLNINGLGAVQLRDTSNLSLNGNDIRDNSTHLLLYDPNRTGMGAFVILSL